MFPVTNMPLPRYNYFQSKVISAVLHRSQLSYALQFVQWSEKTINMWKYLENGNSVNATYKIHWRERQENELCVIEKLNILII